jgi:chondroitin 4-sulfotransferase 11
MISHKFQYIYIHIPKTGGTSIEKFLLSFEDVFIDWSSDFPLGKLSEKQQNLFQIGGPEAKQHNLLKEYEDIYQKNYFSFAFVRNPWSRMVSEYLYLRNAIARIENTSFADFVYLVSQGEKFWPYHCLPQVNFVNKNINFIGKFENLKQDFSFVFSKLGLTFKELEVINKRPLSYNYRDYYNDKTKKIVKNFYEKDIDIFKYSF